MNSKARLLSDPRGLTVTKTFDDLNRLTQIDFPDSTYIEHRYTNGAGIMMLDKTWTRDRLGEDFEGAA